jgi:hypothetical protein
MILYLFATIIIIILILFAYIRINFKFWADQPVMHIYDIQYWFFNKGIIDQRFPEKNKYCDFKSIETIPYNKISDIKKNQFLNLVRHNYLRNRDNEFLPLITNIVPYFVGHYTNSYWSFYWEDTLVQNIKENTIIKDKNLLGVITSRPLHVIINNGNKDAKFNVYYVDYLCVKKSHRKKGIAPNIIQTHEYNQRHLNVDISVSLFKREEELTGIIPLCVYKTYAFSMKKWCKPSDLPPNIQLIKCGKETLHNVFPLLTIASAKIFDITIMPEFSNIMELIKTDNIYVFMLLCENDIAGAYFFRKSCTFIENGAEALTCFASIFDKTSTVTTHDFIHGYKVALSLCCVTASAFQYAVIENISCNAVIIENLLLKTTPSFVSPTAYFFYNFAHHTFNPNKVLILN